MFTTGTKPIQNDFIKAVPSMRKFIKAILLTLNIILVIFYIIGCILPWLSPKYFSILGFVGFGFPYLTALLIFTILFWLFAKPKYSLYLLVIFCLGYKQITAVFAFNTNTTFNINKDNNCVRVLTWNVGYFSAKAGYKNAKVYKSKNVIEGLLKQNADVVCLQEFNESRLKPSDEFLELQKIYEYSFYPFWHYGPHQHRSGCVILSKYPIVFTDSVDYEIGENIIRADIVAFGDTISFFTTHFNSFQFSKKELTEIDMHEVEEKPSKTVWTGIVKKVNEKLKFHHQQVAVVRDFVYKSKHKTILCGDFNEVPNNYVYWQLAHNKQDAFLKKGFGFGKSFNSLAGVLRIDYLFVDEKLTVNQCTTKDDGLSDHAMVIADVKLN